MVTPTPASIEMSRVMIGIFITEILLFFIIAFFIIRYLLKKREQEPPSEKKAREVIEQE